jgi:tellurite resistance protein
MNFNETNTISTEISTYAQQLPMAEQKAILNVLFLSLNFNIFKKRAILERAKRIDASAKKTQDKLTTNEVVKICRAVRKNLQAKNIK